MVRVSVRVRDQTVGRVVAQSRRPTVEPRDTAFRNLVLLIIVEERRHEIRLTLFFSVDDILTRADARTRSQHDYSSVTYQPILSSTRTPL